MKKIRKLFKKYYLVIGFLVVFLTFSLFVILPSFSEDVTTSIWDGTTASSFNSGEGTSNNPYLITNGSELSYLFNSVLTETNYYNKYYKLTNNINLNGYDFSRTNVANRSFAGTIDGNGFSIYNFKINNYNYNSGYYEYSFIPSLSNATIKNLNIYDVTYDINGANYNSRIGLFINANNSKFENVSFYRMRLNINNTNGYIAAGLLINDQRYNTFNKVNVSFSSNLQGSAFIHNYNNSNLNHVFVNKNNLNLYGDGTNDNSNNTLYPYTITNNNILFEEGYTLDILLENISEQNYKMIFNNLDFKIRRNINNNPNNNDNNIQEHASGIFGNTVYINDLVSDYNHYIGLNYTSSSGTTPTMDNKNIYNNTNLIKAQINYHGTNYEKNKTSYVSYNERQSKYVYYKYLVVNDNGTLNKEDDYLLLELIENPFTDLPSGLAFNDWITDYEGVKITLDREVYVRYAKIPIKYINGNVQDININFYMSYAARIKAHINDGVEWQQAFSLLHDAKLHELKDTITYLPYNMNGYYYKKTADYYTYYEGYNYYGSYITRRRCYSYNGCTYYELIQNENFDNNNTYYYLDNGYMNQLDNSTITLQVDQIIPNPAKVGNMSGFYELVKINYGNSLNGYYDQFGNIMTSGNCNNYSGCNYYKKLDFYDFSGNQNLVNQNNTYYYLATRDTNIIQLNGNLSGSWGGNDDKPFTLTSNYDGQNYINNYTWTFGNHFARCNNDTKIQNIRINGNTYLNNTNGPTNSRNGYRYIYANYKNLKLGRGIIRYANYATLNGIIGSANTSNAYGSYNNLLRYRLIVESGFYNNITLTNGPISTSSRTYIEAVGIYGNDYDRVLGDNNKLEVYFDANGTWGGSFYSTDHKGILFDTIVKSGKYGTSKYDYTTGIYVGGRSYGAHFAAKRITVEGGWIYNLIGGPLASNQMKGYNDTYINIKGGEISAVYGGAGRSATHGNRIIQATGGTVQYSLFGGSNGAQGGGEDGTINGDSFIYIGGNAKIGADNMPFDENMNYEVGSVFGVGNGNTSSSSIGSNDNSNIIIDGNAYIKNNVYGGGNYGATGVSSSNNKTKTNIKVLGGIINGSLYGGGNNNGSGSNKIFSTIDILVDGATVNGSVYGGSKTKGTIYGDILLNVQKGTINNDVYGGGEGGYSNYSNQGTFVSGNIDLSIGTNDKNPIINGSVYGGSAYGTVNATTTSESGNNKHVKVHIINGNIVNAVYGGGKGSVNFTPHVKGRITLTVNGGTIGSLYGGFNQAGILSGDSYVYLEGGQIGDAFGAGNNVGIDYTHIYLKGSSVNNLYGGANQSGNIKTSKLYVQSGTAQNIYGGNNIGGNCAVTEVEVTGGNITSAIYGGGNQVSTASTSLNLIRTENTVPAIYGAGNKAGADVTNMFLNGIKADLVFGGANQSGLVKKAIINVNQGQFENVYGGNNNGGHTNLTNVILTSGKLENLYGGGNNASVGTSDVLIHNGEVTKAFGGGNAAKVSTTNIRLNNGKITELYGGGNQAGADITNVFLVSGNVGLAFGGSNQSGNINETNIRTLAGFGDININSLYGGNNAGGLSNKAKIVINKGTIDSLFGGGNQANVGTSEVTINNGKINNLYGGGNQANILLGTALRINDGIINNNAYGGGNYGKVVGNTYVNMNNGKVLGSIYAGGNGSTATVEGFTNINISGTAIIGSETSSAPLYGSVFGGGNAAETGLNSNNNSIASVNIAGGTIYGNVYGGANTSVVYGTASVNIGAYVNLTNEIKKGDIFIRGTVFGGGEANASGSEVYDYSFISVTKGIGVNIDGNNYDNFNIKGSIFGSGNASSTSGTSVINIKNYGTYLNPKKNISIQRANKLTIDNSAIDLYGATDRTNEYSNVLFTFSIIDELILKNNSTLYLQTGANLLKKFKSVDSNDNLAIVNILENGTINKNVDNRLYMFEGKNLNIAKNESVTSYGEVYGMTFFGMYKYRGDKTITRMIYEKHNQDDPLSWGDMPNKGSYVIGLHKVSHAIDKDGFYTNYMNEETTTCDIKYINPTPEDSNFYMWIIGEVVSEYNVDLIASKFSTLGAFELSLLDFAKANTTFEILGFDYSAINPGVNLINPDNIPRVANSTTEADNNMGLTMKTSNTGWLTNGSTSFLTQEGNNILGTKTYVGENSTNVPTLLLYLYHSKNLGSTGPMGTVKINLMAITKIDDLTNENKRLVINVNMSRALYAANEYEAGITAGREYSMFTSQVTNITSKSSISAYFSLFAENSNIYRPGYHRALVTNKVLPLNTKITMIDLSKKKPKYYYHTINEQDVINATNELTQEGDISYNLSLFAEMGANESGVHYDDAIMNNVYYNQEQNISSEEFIFIIDFGDTNINYNMLNTSLLIEMHDINNETIISVLGIEHASMVYNLYHDKDAVIKLEGTLSTNKIYNGEVELLDLTTTYTQAKVGANTIFDTKYFDSKLGIKISIVNKNNEVVSGTSLMGLYYEINNAKYYPNIDGTTRIKIADKVGNIRSWIRINTKNANIPTGNYNIKVESFGSPDGIYYGLNTSDTLNLPVYIINEIYGLDITTQPESQIIEKTTGKNKLNNNILTYNINYNSGLAKPKIHMRLYRRNYDAVYDTNYTLVNLLDYVDNTLTSTNVTNEYLVADNPNENAALSFNMKKNLQSGTYKLKFILYDDNTQIGTLDKYIIIK